MRETEDNIVTSGAEAQALREAVSVADFPGAQRAALRFASLVAEAAAGLPPAESLQRLSDACDLLAWSRRSLCASRARLAGEIRHLEGLRQYQARLAELSSVERR